MSQPLVQLGHSSKANRDVVAHLQQLDDHYSITKLQKLSTETKMDVFVGQL